MHARGMVTQALHESDHRRLGGTGPHLNTNIAGLIEGELSLVSRDAHVCHGQQEALVHRPPLPSPR